MNRLSGVLAGCGLLMAGCAGPGRVPALSTAALSRSVEAAGESARKAAAAVEEAHGALAGARKPVRRLLGTATATQRPDVLLVANALGGADRSLSVARVSLSEARAAEAKALRRSGELQWRIDGLADDLGKAQDAERRSREGSRFWRAWALRLGILAAALTLWTLRRPIAAILGVGL